MWWNLYCHILSLKELETHYLMESNLKECFPCIIYLIINYCPCTIYYLLFMWFLFSSLIVALLCSNIWKNVISLKMHLITGSWTIIIIPFSIFSSLIIIKKVQLCSCWNGEKKLNKDNNKNKCFVYFTSWLSFEVNTVVLMNSCLPVQCYKSCSCFDWSVFLWYWFSLTSY